MRPNYPHDHTSQHYDTCARTVEGDIYHTRLVSGSITVSCTTNTLSTQAITFSVPFVEESTPDIVYSIKTIGNTSSVVKFTDISVISNTGFTLRVLTDTTQSIVFSWHAKGTTE